MNRENGFWNNNYKHIHYRNCYQTTGIGHTGIAFMMMSTGSSRSVCRARAQFPEEVDMEKAEIQLLVDKELEAEKSASATDKIGEPDRSIGKSAIPAKALHEQEQPEDANDGTNSTKSDKSSFDLQHCNPTRSILKRPKGESPTEFIDVQGPWARLQPPDMLEIEKSLRSSSAEVLGEFQRSTMPQEVRFNSVQVRMYGQTLGDNPAVSNGAPIQLDWCYNEIPPIDINLYHAGRTTRPIRQLVLSRYYRHKVLMHWYNFTEGDIKNANLNAKQIRKQRQQTQIMSEVRLFEECLFSLTRIFKGMFGRR